MGEIAEVDLTQLRGVADRVMAAADAIAEMRWPTSIPMIYRVRPSATLPHRCSSPPGSPTLSPMMRGWALAAHMSADAFERADRRNGERFGR